jgi:branched-chain amino acid transport system permease protein
VTTEAPVLLDAPDPLASSPRGAVQVGLSPRLIGIGIVVALLVAAAGLAVPVVVADFYYMSILLDGLLLSFLALSVGFMARHLGIISLGQTAFYGGAAYAVCIATSEWAWSPLQAFLGAVVAGTLLSLVVGVLVVRASGIGFMMLTLALGQAVYQVVVQDWARPVTGSFDGASAAFDDNTFLGMRAFEMLDPQVFWKVAWVLLVGVTLLLWLAGRSRFGLVLEGTRENTERMRFSGYNTFGPRLGAFVLSGFVASVGGGLFALNAGYVSPEVLSFLKDGDALIAAILGGLGILLGPILGALLYIYAQSVFNTSGNLHLYTGLAAVLVLVFMPGGIFGTLFARIGSWRDALTRKRKGGHR